MSSSDLGFLPVYTSHPLDSSQPDIFSTLVIQHGLSANADEYFCDAMQATYPRNNVLVISPLFGSTSFTGDAWQTGGNPFSLSISFNGSSCWLNGCDNAGEPVEYSSSFASYDQLLSILIDKVLFPSTKLITLSGFSAGGQMLNRYSWATAMKPSSMIRFIVGDGGSYLYLNELRPDVYCRPPNNKAGAAVSCDNFHVPTSSEISTCASYNDYKYGLVKLPTKTYSYFLPFIEGGSEIINNRTTSVYFRDIRYVRFTFLSLSFSLSQPLCRIFSLQNIL